MGSPRRAVPLFNSVPGRRGNPQVGIDVWPTISEIIRATDPIEAARLSPDAPPAFLLDAARRFGSFVERTPGVFDNRSVSLPTDLPSAGFLLDAGVRSIVVIKPTEKPPQTDLAHTLRRWQQAGLDVVQLPLDQPTITPITVAKPTWYRSLWHRLIATAGLRPAPLGGFGGTLTMPSQG